MKVKQLNKRSKQLIEYCENYRVTMMLVVNDIA